MDGTVTLALRERFSICLGLHLCFANVHQVCTWTHNQGTVSVCWYCAHTEPPADSDCIFCLSAKRRIRAGRPERQTEVFGAQCEFLGCPSYLDAVVLAATVYMLNIVTQLCIVLSKMEGLRRRLPSNTVTTDHISVPPV